MPGAGDAPLAAGQAPAADVPADALPRFGHRFPYPGLRPFEDHEFDLFFGRTDQVDEIIDRVLATHFASVLGGSGCGKSSLVRAGVIPELRFRGDTWLQVVFNAGQRPVTRLAEALSAVLVKPPGEAADRMRPDQLKRLLTQQNGLAAVVDEFREDFIVRVRPGPPDGQAPGDDEDDRRRLSANAKLLILIDQFEEIFAAETESERLEASQIVRLIVDSFELRHPSVHLVLAMRSENLHSCTAYLDLPRVINRSSYLVRRLDDSEIGRAIVEPARYCRKCMLAGVPPDADARSIGAAEFDPEVVRRLRDEVRLLRDDVDHLPLLQHALFRLWEAALARERGAAHGNAPLVPERITVADLETAANGPTPALPGGSLLRRCVEVHANRLFHALDPREQRVAESAFRLLGLVDENRLIKRRRTRIAEILSTSPRGTTAGAVEKVVERFRSPHPYLRVQGDDIDVAHEAFIRNWKQFGDWIRDEAARRHCYEMLVDRLRKWQAAYRDPSASRLARTARWFRDLLDRHARAEASTHGIARLEPVRVSKYLREIGEDPGVAAADGQPPLHREVLHFLGLSVNRARAIWWLFALLVVTPLALYGLALVEGRQKADLDKEAKAFHSLAVSSTSGNAQHALLPLEERTMRLWEVLAAVHARGSQEPDETGGWANRVMSWLGLDSRDRRLLRAVRLSGRQAQDALRTILTSSVWPTRPADAGALEADLPSPTEAACTRGPGDAPKGSLLVSNSDATRRLFFVPAEGAVYVAETAPGAVGGCRIGQPVLRVAGSADVKADPALRMVVEMSKASASQDGAAAAPADARATSKFAYSFYRVRWSCRMAADEGRCAAWQAELPLAGRFDTQLDEPKAWGVMANGGGFKVIERDGTKRGGMEYAAPFDPVSLANAVDVAPYFAANAGSPEGCVAQLESVKRPSPASGNAPIVAPVKQLRDAKYCAEIGSLSATDQVVNVYALPVSWQATIASEAQAGASQAAQPARGAKEHGGGAMTAKRHLLRFPAASFAFQSPQIRRAAFGEEALEGYLVLETTDGRYLTLLWDLDRLYRKGCDVLYQPALVDHLERMKYTFQGKLRKDERPVHPVFAFLAGSSEEAVLDKAIDAPCETGAPSMPAAQR